jgi:uncharacterized membrane protein
MVFCLNRLVLCYFFNVLKQNSRSRNTNLKSHLILLLIWMLLGLVLRFINLDLKPASSIEIATIGYSLGHGFNAIPLDQVITINTLLSPLHLDSSISYVDVWERLRQESTHPPFYFWLTHWWLKLWTPDGAIVSLFVARSLSAIFGTLAIPGIFGLAWLAFRSWRVAHLAAILMATSPYGIYLAQEARHYTLTVLWVIASLACLVKVLQLINQKALLPMWLLCLWIVINALGFATHYFFVLALGAEVFAVFGYWFFYRTQFNFRYWRGLFLVAIGTGVSYLAWLPVVMGISDNELTDWIRTSFEFNEIFQPVLRLLAWVITMVMLLPVEGVPVPVAIGSGLILLAILALSIPILIRGWRSQLLNSNMSLPMIVFSSYFLGSLIIVFLLIYGVRKDISLAARYHFIYFPILILLLASALAACYQKEAGTNNKLSVTRVFSSALSNRLITVLLIVSFLGFITVVSNLGFQKSRDSDRLAAYIQENLPASNNSTVPLVAMTYKTHSELRELVGLALSFDRFSSTNKISISLLPHFLLLQSKPEDYAVLSSILANFPQTSFNLIGVNFDVDESQLSQLGCTKDAVLNLPNSGYDDRFYRCR